MKIAIFISLLLLGCNTQDKTPIRCKCDTLNVLSNRIENEFTMYDHYFQWYLHTPYKSKEGDSIKRLAMLHMTNYDSLVIKYCKIKTK